MQERPRLRREQLRELVVAAGLEILREDGLAGSTLPVGYADAFRWLHDHRDLTISRAQVHNRIWASLAEYRQDVLLALLEDLPTTTLQAAQHIIEGQLQDHIDLRNGANRPCTSDDSDQQIHRLPFLIDLTRAGVDASTVASRNDPHTVVVEAAWAMHAFRTGDSGEHQRRINTAVLQNYQQSIGAFCGLYQHICQTLGVDLGRRWNITHEEGLHLLAELLSSTNNGAAGRATIEPSLPTISCGGRQWSIAALTAAAIVEGIAAFGSPPIPSGDQLLVDPLPSAGAPAETPPASRLTRDELRQEMIAAGMGWMRDNGFGHGAEHITYARVFERIERQHGLCISRAQVHGRIWESQDDFQMAVIAEATLFRVTPLITELTEDVSALLAGFDITQPGQSMQAVTEIVRRQGPPTIAGMIASSDWRVAGAIAAFHGTNPQRPDRITNALHQSSAKNIEEWTHFYALFAEVFGYRAQRWTQQSTESACGLLARCAVALVAGVAGRTRLTETPPSFTLTIGQGDAAEWDLTGIGNWCLIHFLLEPTNEESVEESDESGESSWAAAP